MAEMLEFAVNLSMLTSGNFNATVGPAAQKAAELSAKMQQLNNTSKNITGYQKQAQKLTTLRSKLDEARKRVKDMQTVMRQGGNVDAKLFTKANEEAAKLQQQVQENTKKLGEFRAELKEAGVNTADLATAQGRLQSQVDKMRAAQERLTAAQTKYANLQGQLSWGNIKGDVMKSAAIVKAFQVPIRVDMEFEQAMAQTKAVALPSPEEFSALEAQAKELGRTTQFSATQAANSQEILMRAGLNTQQVLQNLPSVLNVAAAEGLEIAQAADMLVNATGGMKLDTSMMPIVGDILAYTSSHSNTNIPQLAEAMQIAAPAASDVGMPIEQLASLLGAMSATARGGQAGTAIASTISRLAKAPKMVQDALDTLGVARFTREGELVEIPVLMQQIEEKLATMGKGVAENYRSKIYGQFAPQMSGLYAGIKSGAQAKLELGAYTERDGAAANMALTRNDTLKGDLTALSSAWEGLMIKIGEALAPINRFVTQTLTTGIQQFTAFLNEHRTLADIIVRIGYAYGGWRIFSTVGKYTKLIWQLGSSWLEVGRATKAAAEAAGTVAPHVSRIGAAFSWLKGVIMAHPIIAIGTLVAAGVVLAIQHWDKIKEWWQKFKDWLMSFNWSDMWESAKQAAKVYVEFVKNFWRGVYNFVVNLWGKLYDYLVSVDWSGVWDGIKNAAVACVEWLKSPFMAFADWITNLFSKLNPFNWEMPDWLKSMGGSSANQVNNANAALDGWMPAPVKHAAGGILTRPHIGMVAEAGPEAIIPLRNRHRGLQVLTQAAEILGLPTAIGDLTLTQGIGATSSPALPLPQGKGAETLPLAYVRRGGAGGEVIPSLKELNNNVNTYRTTQSSNDSYSNSRSVSFPNVNLTVNVQSQEGQSNESIAYSIADEVRRVLSDMMSLEERVAFA